MRLFDQVKEIDLQYNLFKNKEKQAVLRTYYLLDSFLTFIYIYIWKYNTYYIIYAAAAKLLQLCLTLCDPIDGSPPGSPVPGIPRQDSGVGCHFLLQCIKVKSESEVTQVCPTPSDPMDCSLPGSSIHGIFQARVLEWVAIAFSDYTIYITCLYIKPFGQNGEFAHWINNFLLISSQQ